MDFEIIDRDIFVNTINSFLSTNSNRPKFLYVVGSKGIGKTSILDKARSKLKTDKINVVLDLRLLSCDILSEFPIIYNIAILLDKYSRQYKYSSLDSYFSIHSISKIINPEKVNLNNLANPQSNLSLISINLIETPSKIIRNIYKKYSAPENEIILLNYIKHVLESNSNRFLFWLENIRNVNSINNKFLQYVQDTNQKIIIEVQSNDYDNIIKSQNFSPDIVDYNAITIKELSDDDALKIFKILKIQKEDYKDLLLLKSNMWEVLKNAPQDVLYSSHKISNHIIKDLNNVSKSILFIINVSVYQVKKKIIFKILKQINFTKRSIKSAIKNLLNLDIIYRRNKFFISNKFLNIESLNDSLKFTLCNEYAKILKRKIKNIENLKTLIKLYFYISPKNFSDIIKNNAKIITKYYSSQETMDKIKFYLLDKERFQSSEINTHRLYLVKLYYKLGHYQEAYSIIEQEQHLTKTQILYKAILLNRIRNYSKSIEFINKNKCIFDEHFDFILDNINIINYGRIRKYEQCKKIFCHYLNMSNYMQYDEYCILLKNTEIFLEDESLIYLKKCLKLVKKRKNVYGETLASYGVLLSWNQKHFRSIRYLNKSKKFLDCTLIHNFYMQNNIIAAKMNRGRFKKKYSDVLLELLSYAQDDFDKISIAGNILISESNFEMINNANIAEKLILDIVDKERKIDELITIIVLKQIIYFHKTNKKNSDTQVLDKCQKLVQNIYSESTNKKLIDSELCQIINNTGFIVNFLTFWNFDIKDFDE